MGNKFYITTPIYYVNDIPHIGHTVTTIMADIVARYQKLQGKKVFFLTGTDEHGAKVAEAAKKERLTPKRFCDKVSQTFSEIWPRLDVNFNYFIRTTNPQHKKVVQDFLEIIYKNGDIYKSRYEGYYCVGCERFVTETDLVDGHCPYHPDKELQKQSEENYFFKLSKYAPILIEAIENPNHQQHYDIYPEGKKLEVLARLKSGVDDLSISRAEVAWGIPVPWDKSQTVYVWIDALINYYSALKINKNEEFWPADLHLIGKEILWFHAAIWEALLLAAGISLPKIIYAHSFYTIDGQKMSKSLGNVISPQQLLEKYGVDGTRYLLAASFPALEDSDVGIEKFTQKYNSDLANGLGNLVARLAKLCQLSKLEFILKIPEFSQVAVGEYQRKMEDYRLNEVLSFIWGKIKTVDRYLNQEKPWEIKNKARLRDSLQEAVAQILKIAVLLDPFLPQTSEKIKKIFIGRKIISCPSLFPRIKE